MFHHFNIWIFFISFQLKSEVFAENIPHGNEVGGFDLSEEELRKFHIWPLGDIPYYIDDFSFDKVLRDQIRYELDLINKATGLHFKEIPRPPEDDTSRWVFFLNRKGQQDCVDIAFKNFTTEGVQKLVLGYECLENKNLAGIVLALVGVPPQHNAPNRDQFIKIHQNNILPDKIYLFEILKDSEWLFHDMSYDIESAGHYPFHQYTSNGAATITLLQDKASLQKFEPSPHHKLSSTDIKKIKKLYNYISRKRHMPQYLEGCDKLFQPGSNISNFKISKDNVKPLRKPNKYLGISSNASVNNDDEYHGKENASTTTEENVMKEKNTTDILDPKEEGNKEPDDKDPKTELEENKTKEKNNTTKDNDLVKSPNNGNLTVLKHQSAKDTILDQSDYHTD